ncbi:MAG: metallophosphoesterase [bacterium]
MTHSTKHSIRNTALILALLPPGAFLHAVSLTRGPYLQNLQPSRVTIVWKTDMASDSEIVYGPASSYGFKIGDPSTVTQHALTIPNLAKSQTYHYKVKSGGAALTGDLTFRAGKDSTFTSFTFAAMGDHRSSPPAHLAIAQRVRLTDPELILDTGDLTNDGNKASNWDPQFFTPEKDVMSRICLFPSIGNHDGTAQNYLDYFVLPAQSSGSERYYSFDYANAHYVVIDSYSNFSQGSAQHNWLVRDLEVNKNKPWLFAMMHNPPYSSSSHGSDLPTRNTLCPLFEAGGVDVVFSGHDHDYERSLVNGVLYIVTGGGGAPLYKSGRNSWTQFSSSQHHFTVVNVDNTTCAIQAVASDGAVIDAVSLSPSGVREWHREADNKTETER